MRNKLALAALLALLAVPLCAQTIRPTRISQIQWTSLTTAQEAGMTLAEGSFWYNSDLKCYRYRSATSTYCIAGEEANPSLSNGIRVVNGSGKFAQNSTGLQAAIDEVEAANGGMIFLPCGVYPITSPMTATMPSNNLGFKMVGAGLCTVLQPDAGMTILTVDMGGSNYQSLYLADFGFDLNGTNSTAMSFVGSGQKGVVERIYIDGNDASATANIITVDNTSHTMRLEDIRIRGSSATADGISISSNAVILDGLDITGSKAAVIVPTGSTINALTIKNSRLDGNVSSFKIDGAAALKINYINNHSESNTGPHLDIKGLNGAAGRVFGLTVRDSYFTGMDLAAEDGLHLENLSGAVLEGNHFKGSGTVAEAVTYLSASVSNISLDGNTVDAVLSSMTGASGVPLEVDDVTVPQTSKQFGAASIASAGSIVTSGGNIGSSDTTNPVAFFGSRAAAGGTALRVQTTNSSDALTTRIEITGKEDTAELRFLNSDLVANPKEGTLSNVPRWIFKQVDFGDMTAAATADTFTLWTLPANTMIHDVVGAVVTGWSGGSISAAVCSVGTAGGSANDLALDDDFFAAATVYELHDATASGGKGGLLFDATDKFAPTMFVAGGVVEIQCDLTGDNHANATAGQARIYILVSQPLGNTATEAN